MDNVILGSVIGVGGAITGGLVAPAYSWIRERRIFPKIENDILHLLTDSAWSGTVQDVYTDDGMPCPSHAPEEASLIIRQSNWSPTLTGTLNIKRFDGTKAEIIVEHGIVRDRYLLLHYRNQENVVRHLGAICLELSPLGDMLIGFWSGWSPWRQTYVCGSMKMTKN